MTSPGDERFDEHLIREAAAALPPRRNDEPASLRQDILDELGDHLACAYRRELLRTGGDAPRSQRNVRDRFGNPSAVARRLWFDAMKGKLMAQKILIGTCAVVVAACAVFGVLLWQTAVAARDANTAMLSQMRETNAALIEQNQQANAALLKQMESLRKSAAAPDPQWNPVKIRVVTGSKDGPPAEGVSIYLSPKTNTSGLAANGTTDSDGVADMGLVQPGAYQLSVYAPGNAWLKENLAIRAGRETTETIICPPAPARTPIQFAASWPESMRSHPDRDEMWCVVGIARERYQRVEGYDRWMYQEEDERLLAFHPDGRVIDLLDYDPPDAWKEPRGMLEPREELPELPENASNLPDNELPSSVVAFRKDWNDVRRGIDYLQHGIIESRKKRGDKYALQTGAMYKVHYVILVRWDGSGSPLTMYAGVKSVQTFEGYGGQGTSELATEVLANRGLPVPTMQVPMVPQPRMFTWTIPIPDGLLTEGAKWDVPTVFGKTTLALKREPVEAPRPRANDGPFYLGGTLDSGTPDEKAMPVRIECLAGSKDGQPLAGVNVQLDREGFVSGDGWRWSRKTDDKTGSVLYQLPPGSYSVSLTTPWDERFHKQHAFVVEDWRISDTTADANRTRVETFVCPAEPPKATRADFDIRWPAAASRRDDLWLVLELSSRSRRTVGELLWETPDWHLVAIHPSGRVVSWKKDPAEQHVSWHQLDNLPAMLTQFVQSESPPAILPSTKFQILGMGIARWDGTGDASQILKGLRDGRYESLPRGAFFYVLRNAVPMKADESLPAMPVATTNNQPQLSFTVPERFLTSALGRWENVPAVK